MFSEKQLEVFLNRVANGDITDRWCSSCRLVLKQDFFEKHSICNICRHSFSDQTEVAIFHLMRLTEPFLRLPNPKKTFRDEIQERLNVILWNKNVLKRNLQVIARCQHLPSCLRDSLIVFPISAVERLDSQNYCNPEIIDETSRMASAYITDIIKSEEIKRFSDAVESNIKITFYNEEEVFDLAAIVLSLGQAIERIYDSEVRGKTPLDLESLFECCGLLKPAEVKRYIAEHFS